MNFTDTQMFVSYKKKVIKSNIYYSDLNKASSNRPQTYTPP